MDTLCGHPGTHPGTDGLFLGSEKNTRTKTVTQKTIETGLLEFLCATFTLDTNQTVIKL